MLFVKKRKCLWSDGNEGARAVLPVKSFQWLRVRYISIYK